MITAFVPLSASAEYVSVAQQQANFFELSVDQWQPVSGDEFLADTKDNVGYLIHTNGDYLSFPIATGQHRKVHYMGKTYDAATPVDHWTVLSKKVQSDRVTFGPDGLFLRLYKGDSEEYTSYGIHTHQYISKMLADDMRYRSMGCILVSKDILDIVEKTFEVSNDRLPVTTVYGLDTWNGAFASYNTVHDGMAGLQVMTD